jgi:glucokinase
MKKFAIGVDIGGSHISCAAVNLQEKKLLQKSFYETDVDNNSPAPEILNSWASALNQALSFVENDELAGIGFGMPGPFEYPNGIARFEQVEKYYGLNGVNVAEELLKLITVPKPLPLRFMNDASAFAAGEAWVGAAAGTSHSVSITLGTGFGSAFISNGVPVVSGQNVPRQGCVWHLPYKDSIADDYFSTRWLVKRYNELTGFNVSGAKAIAIDAQNSEIARRVFVEYGTNMGTFISPWLKKFDAGVLVIGGNIAAAYPLFGPSFEKALKEAGVKTALKLSALKEHAAIMGSARLLDEKYWEKVKPVIPLM